MTSSSTRTPGAVSGHQRTVAVGQEATRPPRGDAEKGNGAELPRPDLPDKLHHRQRLDPVRSPLAQVHEHAPLDPGKIGDRLETREVEGCGIRGGLHFDGHEGLAPPQQEVNLQ